MLGHSHLLHLLVVHHLLLLGNTVLFGDPFALDIYRNLLDHLILLNRFIRSNLISNILDLVITQIISQLCVLISRVIWMQWLIREKHLVCDIHTEIAFFVWISILSNWYILTSKTLASLPFRTIVPLIFAAMETV